MKSIHPSLYRVRSNSLTSVHRPLHTNGVVPLTFFDSPPPPLRPGVITSTSRLSAEHPSPNSSTQQSTHSHGGHPPLPLALGTTSSNSSQFQSQYALFTYSSSPPKAQSHAQPPHAAHETPLRAPKRQRLKYHLDVGAYGIPKRCRADKGQRGVHTRPSPPSSSTDELSLAVQVGEDAYFVRDNAMGVADGVGGWTKSKHQDPLQPTASALFARRLMHNCSAEIESSRTSHTPKPQSPRPHFSFSPHFKPRTATQPAPIFSTASSIWDEIETQRLKQEEMEEELLDSLDELSEGIDVLQILERAYDHTIKTHVSSSSPLESSPMNPMNRSNSRHSLPPPSTRQNESTPLMSGSSTALLAVLDHAPQQPVTGNPSMTTLSIVSSAAHPPLFSSAPPTSTPITNYAAGTLHPSIFLDTNAAQSCDAVIRIAHVGDCMGMLVREQEIIWRSEEMWWDFNMPLQLGPATHPAVTPITTAHHFTLPVRADDILILASDGLSDNLWDEEVLDEVIKFRRSFLGKETAETDSSASISESGPTDSMLCRKTLAGMLSEALCSRARKVSERQGNPKGTSGNSTPREGLRTSVMPLEEDEIPFARRARQVGRSFRGGKHDDISVIVAVISPAKEEEASQSSQT